MSKKKKGRNSKLYKNGLLSEAALVALDEKLAREIAVKRSKKMVRVNEMQLEVELLKNGLTFL